EIRVLTLLPGTYDDPIDIKLTKHWIENDPTYEALSYVWGIEMSVHLASVNNILMEITENLDIALRHLRYESEHRFMWIDALCINQEDMQERNHQVQLMGPIYANATKVVIWLGPSADNSDYVMDCVGKRDIEEPKIPYFCHYVNKLLERPWFYRVWVVQ
ncbi:heterokaryon incompatibility, partial [Amniculicola lignicola CBS 123094]